MRASKEKRLGRILEILEREEKMRVRELADELEITPETLRSDLADLVRMSVVEREHGYVRLVQAPQETPMAIRSGHHVQEKIAVAYAALSTVKDGQVIYVDAGSTVLLGLQALARRRDLLVATNSLPGALKLAQMNIRTLVVGGMAYNPGERTYGNFATSVVDHIQFDVVFLGTDGFQDARGFTTVHDNELGLKRHLIAQTEKVVVVCDRSKFHDKAPFMFCTFAEADLLVTNRLTKQERNEVDGVREILEV